ncbi:carbohydrate esterase [Flavobacterium sp. CS20]|uniref:DUF7033 domain-containing protein n=1 Tax=Flavobacterium sp. CS20 TaxID=2775246 RepID=UPI001B3A71F4|nr:carbohydrate esterase [Flavobacterium sp. CS20]QTY25882.1 carbohydrate esterase [Flavobacterium sp. CS20]
MEILIYVPEITPRINYTFRQVCKRILGFKINFTTKIETFIAYKGAKFSYANQRLGNEVFIQACGLLQEQGVNDLEINVSIWQGEPYFFKTSLQSDIPYDIFLCSFFLLTRYEEYLPHVKNRIGDFPAQESLAYKNGFLQKPIVNIWIDVFSKILQNKFKDINLNSNSSQVNIIVAVEKAFKYRKYGISRSIAGFVGDTIQLKFSDVYSRIKTWFYSNNDPFDVYDELIRFKNDYNVDMKFMFLLGDYSINTKNINHRKKIYQKLIKSMGDYCEIGLMPSHEAIHEFDILNKEIDRFEKISNRELESIMIKDYELNFPDFYISLDKTNIKKDFSMGYSDHIGYRAGTSHSFLFYDLNLEQASPIEIHPFFASSQALKNTDIEKFYSIKNELNCSYNLLISNEDFSNTEFKQKIYQITKHLKTC